MNKFHGRWIIGLLLIFLDINILFDWLPDFIGWLFIAAAFTGVKGEGAAWGKWGAIVASILSLPLTLNEISMLPEREYPLWLEFIYFTLPFVQFLAYAAFFIISDSLLERQKQSVFSYVFLGYLLVWKIWQHVNMHVIPNEAENITSYLGITGLVLMFCFLINVIKRNNEWKWKKEVEERLREIDEEEANGNVY